MTQELIYTSAPRGLKPGSRGFCTVVTTQGMASNLIDRLEALSGYRHVYGGANGREVVDQVVSQHVRISMGGRQLHVLSRIHSAGVDYSQRSNKFAHHVVLDSAELPAAGPAWLLQHPGFIEETWDEQPRLLPSGRPIPPGQVLPGICRAWASATGDAGWGGVLASTVAGDGRKSVTIVIRPGFDPLPLVAESIALLPEHLRWGVSFSTFFTKLPPGVDCIWRFVIQGSPEAAAAARGNQGLLINLCQPSPHATGSPFADAARSGAVVSLPPPPQPQRLVAALPTEDELAQLLAEPGATSVLAQSSRRPGLVLDEGYAVAHKPPVLAPPIAASPALPNRPGFKKRTKVAWYVVGGVAVVVVLTSVGAAVWLGNGESNLASVRKATSSKDIDDGNKKTSSDTDNSPRQDSRSQDSRKSHDVPNSDKREITGGTNGSLDQSKSEKSQSQPPQPQPPQPQPPQPQPAQPQSAQPQPAQTDILKPLRGKVFTPPKRSATSTFDKEPRKDRATVGSLEQPVPANLHIQIVGGEFLDRKTEIVVEKLTTTQANLQQSQQLQSAQPLRWAVKLTCGGLNKSDVDVARFIAVGDRLDFEWQNVTDAPIDLLNQLSNCILKLSVEGSSEPPVHMPLRDAIVEKPITFEKFKNDSKFTREIIVDHLSPKLPTKLELITSQDLFPESTLDPSEDKGKWRWTIKAGQRFSMKYNIATSTNDIGKVMLKVAFNQVDGVNREAWKDSKPETRKEKDGQIVAIPSKRAIRHRIDKTLTPMITNKQNELINLQQQQTLAANNPEQLTKIKEKITDVSESKRQLEDEKADTEKLFNLYECYVDPERTQLQFRLYAVIDGCEVDLVRSELFTKVVKNLIQTERK
jgi:hypothetical protein